MNPLFQLQGRQISADDISQVRQLLCDYPQWNRTRLSRELCTIWDWRSPTGRLKDMACRSLLLKLEQRGCIRLPPREASAAVNALRNRTPPQVPHATDPIHCTLDALTPLRILPVDSREQRALFRCLVGHYHYLGLKNTVGENLSYLVVDRHQRPLACLLFGSAAWKAEDRDRYIGWSVTAREGNLSLITNNTRFLVLPWVRVPHLCSHVLSRIARRLSSDWQAKYGHPIHLLETFVERDRFTGTAYRSANWIHVGVTKGRQRNDRTHQAAAPVKDIWVYPLSRRVHQVLRDG